MVEGSKFAGKPALRLEEAIGRWVLMWRVLKLRIHDSGFLQD